MTNSPEDFIGEIKKNDAAKAAQETAIAAPARPKRQRNVGGKAAVQQAYIDNALSDEVEKFAALTKGDRNQGLNDAAFNLAQLVNPIGIEPGVKGLNAYGVENTLADACRRNGVWDDPDDGPAQCRKTFRSGFEAGLKQPRDLSDVGRDAARGKAASKGEPAFNPIANGSDGVQLRRLSTVKSRVPMWVWQYKDNGRIQLGTLTLFAGKPMAGKSTAARWFAARISQGELPGVWFGYPMKVAMIMAEEQTDAVVVPSLAAMGADLDNIFTPEVKVGGVESAITFQDYLALREELLDNQIRVLFIDPVMSLFPGKSDIYRNNEVREALNPFKNLAKEMNGIVIGVTHLRKGDVRDLLGSVNGSAAFTELPRAVFGFAPMEDGAHVMEQIKNSAGPIGLKLEYRLPLSFSIADDGQPIDLPVFDIRGETEISVSDINPSSDETTSVAVACNWLSDYLMENQPAPSAQVKLDAKKHGDIKEWTLKRAMQRLRVRVWSQTLPGKPYTTVWSLPDDQDGAP